MTNYATYAKQELPYINTAIAESIADLPPLIHPIAKYTLLANGKKLRPMLVVLFAKLFGYTQQDLYPFAISVEFLHVATLLHDDVIDNATLRRGKSTAHNLYGTVSTILAGDVFLAKGNHLVASYGNQQATLAISKALSQTAYGETLEIMHQGNIIDETTYLDIITGKTAWIISVACELGALKANASPQQVHAAAIFGLNLGIAFQIIDDALDFSNSDNTGKTAGGDIREGKFTLPLSYYMQSLPNHEQTIFLNKFKNSNFTDEEILTISQTVQKKGFDTKTRYLADSYLKKAVTSLELLANIPNPEYKNILAECLDYIYTRKT